MTALRSLTSLALAPAFGSLEYELAEEIASSDRLRVLLHRAHEEVQQVAALYWAAETERRNLEHRLLTVQAAAEARL